MFQGKFEHGLDEKGRLAVPASFRGELGACEDTEAEVIITISDRCLAAYPTSAWSQHLEMIGKLNPFDKQVIAFKRIFVGHAQKCQIDKAGRVNLAPALRQYAGIKKECVIIGQLEKFEIWAEEAWNDTFANMTDQVGAIYAALAEHGIQL